MTRAKNKISLEELSVPSYEEIIKKIKKKVGNRPPRPKDLARGEWSEQALKVLAERYLQKDNNLNLIETPEDMCWRVAWEVASAEASWGASKTQVETTAKDFYRLMILRDFLPNSPTLMNAGTGNGLQYSACFVLPVEDSMEGIFDALKYQAIIHKTGGGTGFSFSRLRPRGSLVKTSSGTASGPVSFMRIFDAATNEVKQGGKRRGANMGILRVDHPDIKEFIHCKKEGGITNFNISVAITDAFMEAFEKDSEYELVNPKDKKVVGSLKAKEIFEEIVQAAWETGDPGLLFLDRLNRGSSNPVPALGEIEATNPCVTGNTLISTDEGLVPMKKVVENHLKDGDRCGGNIGLIVDKRTLSFGNGTCEGRAVKFFDNGVKETLKLITKMGFELTGTLDHKVLTATGWIKLKDLKEGNKVFIQSGKGRFNKNASLAVVFKNKTFPKKWSKELGETLGWLVGDGWLRSSGKDCRVGWTFGKDDIKSLKYLKAVLNKWYGKEIKEVERVRNTYHLSYHGKNFVEFFNKLGVKPVRAGEKEVPEFIYTATEEAVKGFVRGLFTADGTIGIQEVNKTKYIRLTSKSRRLLQGVQLLLLNLGIMSKIYNRSRKIRKGVFKYLTKNGVNKSYIIDGILHELQISRDQIPLFISEIGFLNGRHSDKVKKLKSFKNYYSTDYEDVVFSVISAGKQRVYDLTEEKSLTFISNGIVSLDCGEQPLYPYDACNLGSIFLTYFVKDGGGLPRSCGVDWEKLGQVTKQAVRFLDDVIEINPFPLEQIRKMVFNLRRIGLGVGGFADLLVELGIPYDSEESLSLAEKLMEFIENKAVEATQELAKARGPFPLWKHSIYKNQKPRRNSTVTTIAPTGTISIIAGASSGIEPLFAIAYQHIVKDKHLDRQLSFINPIFEKVAKEKGFWSEEIANKVAEKGVIRDIAEIPQEVRAVFATAHEIDPKWHVKIQSVFQKYTDNAVSKTINLRNGVTVEDVEQAYLLAWETDCKGITVFRDGSKEAQVLNLGLKNGEANTEPLRERPSVVKGSTYRLDTPVGSAFITINEDGVGDPLEIFINVGKAGSDVTAMAEALGRTISTTLRFRGDISPKEKAKEIAHQLSGIGGRHSVGFGTNKIRSLPDAVSTAIATHFGFKINSNGTKITTPEVGDICPSCGAGTLVYEEGCSKCHTCGHSEC